jgi:quinol monooxygenase YgiN
VYGTIARLHVKPGVAEQFFTFLRESNVERDPGLVAEYIYQMDDDPDVYYLTVVFESKAAYVANAQRPETDARYRRALEYLVSEPEWHDGEIVFTIT